MVDREFGVGLLQAERVPRFVARVRKNFVARRAAPPDYRGRGRPAERGAWVRPLARTYKGKETPATPPDWGTTWREGEVEVRAEVWQGLWETEGDLDASFDSPHGGGREESEPSTEQTLVQSQNVITYGD